MAGIGPPEIIARCPCGEILVKNNPEGKPYWTRYEVIVNHLNALLKEGKIFARVKCPICKGQGERALLHFPCISD